MKRGVLDRYERDAGGRVILDVTAARVEDLYNDFDKSAPHVKRDLDPDLAEYLTGCVRELGRAPFLIRFTLAEPPDEPRQARVRRSVNAYFHYLTAVEAREILQMFRRSAILFTIGLALLFGSVSLNQALGPERSVTANVFAEGLTVAAWVSLWEALAIFLIEWFPHRRYVRIYRRLALAELVFRSREPEQPPRPPPGADQGTGGPPWLHD